MKNILKLIVTIIALSPIISYAETAYINDNLYVPLRSGAGLNFRIIHKGIKSGTKLELINRDESTGYSEVRTPDGMQGFLPSRFLTDEPIARQQLVSANQQLANLKKENAKLESELASLKKEHQTLNSKFNSTQNSLEDNSAELERIKSVSANALNLDRRNRELRESNEQLRNDLELLQVENMRLKDKSESNMLMIGGGLVLLGVMIALILPMVKPSRKNDSWA